MILNTRRELSVTVLDHHFPAPRAKICRAGRRRVVVLRQHDIAPSGGEHQLAGLFREVNFTPRLDEAFNDCRIKLSSFRQVLGLVQ